jgi:putative phosphoesterase
MLAGPPTRVGVISDTHGLLRPEAKAALQGSQLIIHAGDVGTWDVLDELATVAPVVAVRGNTDHGGLEGSLSLTEVVEVGPALVYVVHILEDMDLNPLAAGFAAVIYGHTHTPRIQRREGVLYLNPGSAGPRRFDKPVTLARVTVGPGRQVEAEIVELGV